MSIMAGIGKMITGQARINANLLSTTRFEWTASLLSALIVGGVYLDGWAHNHGKVDQTFFTPWHALLYSSVFIFALFLAINQLLNMRKGYAWQSALPVGYRLSLVGAFLFLFGGALDLLWHTLFGIEVDLETLLSPTHLLLATSAVLMVSGPVRSAWAKLESGAARGWKLLGPVVLSVTLVLSTMAFMTQFAHPIARVSAAKETGVGQRNSDIFKMLADGTGQTRLTVDLKQAGWGPAVSPDGQKIAFCSWSTDNPDRKPQLFLMNADGSHWVQLTHNNRSNMLPAWSPDGTRIAFISQTGNPNTADVYLINADGTNETRLMATPKQEYGVTWSPDGKQIAFGSAMDGTWQIYLMAMDGSKKLTKLPSGGGNSPAWSPDGTKIAFTSNRAGAEDIYVMNADGSDVRRLTSNGADNYHPSWSPDGKQFLFASTKDGQENIFVMNADGSGARDLSQDPDRLNLIPNWTADGKSVIYTTLVETQSGQNESLGVASILLQTALLMGSLLLVALLWKLPFGALTLLIFLSSLLMSTQHDHYELLPAALLAGISADLLLVWLKPSITRWVQLAMFAFFVPAVFYSLYFLTVQVTNGISWTLPLWLGSIFMAGIVGLLLSFLAARLAIVYKDPTATSTRQTSSE